METTDNNKTCPICKKDDKVIAMFYGEPDYEILTEAEKGNIILAGCCIVAPNAPKYYCKRDDHEF